MTMTPSQQAEQLVAEFPSLEDKVAAALKERIATAVREAEDKAKVERLRCQKLCALHAARGENVGTLGSEAQATMRGYRDAAKAIERDIAHGENP